MFLLCSSLSETQGQSNKYISLKGSLNLGCSRPLDGPSQFPIGYSDAQLFPSKQTPNLGYQYSLSVLYPISKSFSIGINSYISNYSMIETGEELNFWSNNYKPYAIQRSFRMYGIGLLAGYTIFADKNEKLQTYAGVNYGEFLSTENVFLGREHYNRTKYLASFSLEYARLIADKLFLVFGIISSIGLNDFYDNIMYTPITYAMTIGMEKQIAMKKRS